MGVGGNFWELLKPYAQNEGMDFLREKKVAVDLSFWIVQHETAVRNTRKNPTAGGVRNPHLRVTFFRTINLFAKMGAYPVFVVDGEPSPLKSQARIERFCRASGLDFSSLGLPKQQPDDGDGSAVQRNRAFTRCVRECVELLELLGMPILRARSEAEALCARLNREGHVDACITADSDALLFGAKCVIKCLQSNSKEPFECYHVSNVEAGLGLKRKQLIAISLLVGNDHDLLGVPGIGVETAVRFVQLFNEDEILNRLSEVGKGCSPLLHGNINSGVDIHIPSSDERSSKTRSPHCSNCGHPGSKKAHLKTACEYCNVYGNENCLAKPAGFKCECSDCEKVHRSKEQKKHETWQFNVCQKIAADKNFPNNKIIEMYLTNNHGNFSENDGPSLSWENPKIDDLVDYLAYHQHWMPSYTRQRILPMLSTIFLRKMASNPKEGLLLCGQYAFHSIQRVKKRYRHLFYVVKWKRSAFGESNLIDEQSYSQQREPLEVKESTDLLDEPDVPIILIDDGCWFLVTDENMGLVQAAFPKEVKSFLQEKELKESKSKQRKTSLGSGGGETSESPKSSRIQLSITEFYRSRKGLAQSKAGEDPLNKSPNESLSGENQNTPGGSDQNFSKSVRRRLLFD